MRIIFLAFAFWICSSSHSEGQTPSFSAAAAVSRENVFAGEPFRFQIQVQGSENPDKPDTSVIKDFSVSYSGGGSSSSSSVTIINGRMTRTERLGYNFNYQLVAKRTGVLTIPAITVTDGAKSAVTQPIQINVSAPKETDNFKLRCQLSKNRAFVGEPIVVDWIFYYGESIQEPNLNMPILDIPGFQFFDLESPSDGQTERLEGRQFNTTRLRKALIPEKAGNYSIPASTLSFRGTTGYREDYDFFGRRIRRPVMERMVVPSNEISLEVLEVPLAGRPPNFGGHVGNYRIRASATPSEVNVGDPITLNIAISGPDFLEPVTLPPLNQQPSLANDFRIPNEAASGEIAGNEKRFTQTIRAARAGITEIPPIELPYFDTTTETYRIAKTSPIPIKVNQTKIITAGDAEGLSPVSGQTSQIQAWTQGIAHNYEKPDALKPQALNRGVKLATSPLISTLLIPPLLYFGLLGFLYWNRRKNSDPLAARERKAYGEFRDRMEKCTHADQLLEALQNYMGDKLGLTSGALTYKDIKTPLENRGVDSKNLSSIKAIFDECEASRYARGDIQNLANLKQRATDLVDDLENTLIQQSKPFDFLNHIPGVKTAGILLLCLLPGTLSAALGEPEINNLFQEGNDYFREGNELSAIDPVKAKELYRKAILRFERIIREGGVENGYLYYNIGNAWFRSNDIGRAILNYRRAERFLPHDTNLLQNLDYARLRRTDKIEEEENGNVRRTLFFWHYDISASIRRLFFTLSFITIWISAGARLFFKRSFLKWTMGISAALAILFFISLAIDASETGESRPGVIISDEVIARKGDSHSYEQAFREPLHAGTEFDLIDKRAGWLQVRLKNGKTCWLPESTAELVTSR